MYVALRIEQDKNRELVEEHEARCGLLEATIGNERLKMEESKLMEREEWESDKRELQVDMVSMLGPVHLGFNGICQEQSHVVRDLQLCFDERGALNLPRVKWTDRKEKCQAIFPWNCMQLSSSINVEWNRLLQLNLELL